jgi:1-acyl-sn-glycerol-3-phosphate acyltransferase
MNPWVPISPCSEACATDTTPSVRKVTQWRRGAALIRTVLGAWFRLLLVSTPGSHAPHRKIVCSAARILTALGVRVEVTPSTLAWPRADGGRLVVANHISWIDDLALLSVVPGVPIAKAQISAWPLIGALARRIGAVFVERTSISTLPAAVTAAEDRLRRGQTVLVHPEGTTTCGAELGRFRRSFFQAAVATNAPVCPVAIRYRHDGGQPTTLAANLGGAPLWRSLRRILAARDLVVELHLLPALHPAGTDRRILAALAEYAIAEVTEARPPITTTHPLPSRPRPLPSRRPLGPTPTRRTGDQLPAPHRDGGVSAVPSHR